MLDAAAKPPEASLVRRVVFASVIGTIIEQYDFFIYNTAAALVLNRLFFPQVSPIMGTLLAFLTSATGYMARPVGAMISGHFGDRAGRKALLMGTILVMGFSTFAIGLLPTYSRIGLWAPFILLALRILQGLAVGGEFGGAALMINEYASARHRTFWGSLITVGILLGLILAIVLFAGLSNLPESSLFRWGWRVPFLLSSLLVAVGLYIRLNIEETPQFREVIARGQRARRPLLEVLRRPKALLVIFAIRWAENFSFYVFSAFSLAYISVTLGLSRSLALRCVLIASCAECVSAIACGALADRIGASKLMLFGLVAQFLFSFPFFWLIDTRHPLLILLSITTAFAICNGPVSSVQAGWFPGFFSVNLRASGLGIGREIASVVGGGFAPVVATSLISRGYGSWPIAACMAFTTLLGLIAMVFVAKLERENRALHGIISQPAPR